VSAVKILFLCEIGDPGVGSSTRLMYQLARRLRLAGHKTRAVCTVRQERDTGEREVEGMLVHHLHSDYPLRFRPWRSLHNRAIDGPLEKILGAWRPDVVHAHLIHSHIGYHALTQAARSGAGVVFTAHDVMVFCYQKLTCFHGGAAAGGELRDYRARAAKCIPCQRLRFRPGRNRVIREVLARDVQRFTTVSHELRRAIEANGIRVHSTVHNAIELEASPPGEGEVRALREQLELGQRPLIALGGRLHEQKGVGLVLELLAELAPRHPDLALLVLGHREAWEGEFRARAQALGVEERVIPTGWLAGAELRAAYAAVDVFLMPSLCFDTFGIVNLEAMEVARPVIGTSFGGVPEVIDHGVSGFVANPFDRHAWREHLSTLLANPDLARGMGRAGRHRLEQHFSLESMTTAYLAEYEAAREQAAGAAGPS
jgi:glycosyltransferase involved in cell wall biosynthesis